jgi:DNA adenine methylase
MSTDSGCRPGRPVRPFLKWAGGKRQLLPQLQRLYPAEFGQYWEPFLGSGAVFFDLCNRQRLAGRRVRLADTNPDLVGCFRALREDVEGVIRELRGLAAAHRRAGSTHYYAVRDRRFNPRRAELAARGEAGWSRYDAELAAMFIYLNRTGYNGLFRLNSQGAFNVPVGRYPNPNVCDAENLRRAARALAGQDVAIDCAGFERAEAEAQPGDFLYFDPPYAPVSPTARFTSYTAGGFSLADQQRLQQAILTLAARGCLVVLSNSCAPEIVELYERNAAARRAGLVCRRVPARRAINSKSTSRGPVAEYLIANLPESAPALG